jgi:phosphohistidine phosphatase
MLTLSLLRHAKSSWDVRGQPDAERPLNPRGRAAAPLMGRHMAALGLVPDRILCSTAMRARETAALVLVEVTGAPAPSFHDALYLASPARLLAEIARSSADVGHLMIIGHNPGLHELALELVAEGAKDDLKRLAAKLPTAGLVVIAFKESNWRQVRTGRGRLIRFVTPRRLEAGDDRPETDKRADRN